MIVNISSITHFADPAAWWLSGFALASLVSSGLLLQAWRNSRSTEVLAPAKTSEPLLEPATKQARWVHRQEFLATFRVPTPEVSTPQTTQQAGRAVVLCFDLERLASLNALLGFESGDEAIALTARRAGEEICSPGLLTRLGGGTFAAWVPLPEAASALQMAQALHLALRQSVQLSEQVVDLGVVVGAATSPEHGETTAALLRRAEQALFEAKRLGAPALAYHPSIETARLQQLELSAQLLRAVDNGELVVYATPRLNTGSPAETMASLYLRWHHPTRGPLEASDFLPFAQEHGHQARLTQLLLRTAVQLLGAHPQSTLKLALPLTERELREPALVGQLQDALSAHSVAAYRLTLTVTETVLQTGGDAALARLAELRVLGLGVAIKDFGTQPAALASLVHLPATELILDRSFTADVDHKAGRAQLLASIIDMAHSLGYTVTAQQVETGSEEDKLVELGCDHLQGPLIGQPLPVLNWWAGQPQAATATAN